MADPPPTRPTTAREALIAEAIGDVGRLLDRLDPLLHAMDASLTALADAHQGLDRRLGEFHKEVDEFIQRVKVRAVEHVARRTNEIAEQSMDEQTRAMAQAARRLFNDEVGPALRRLTLSLRQIVEKTLRPWDEWLTHAATAVTSSAITWGLTVYLAHR